MFMKQITNVLLLEGWAFAIVAATYSFLDFSVNECLEHV